jgi:uncharacterized protein (TIGR01370 family)
MGLFGALAAVGRETPKERWVVYYSNRVPLSTFDPYSTLILDSRYHPPLADLSKRGKRLIGYVSIGEASPDYAYYKALQEEGLLVRPNPAWAGNYLIDIRDRRWQARLCDSILPAILARGFDGLFLDTLDSALHLETLNPLEFSGMTAAAIGLVRRIRKQFAGVTLIMNRAYSLLEQMGGDIDAALGESVFATYDFSRKEYCLVESGVYHTQVIRLQAAVKRHSSLRVFTLDYWNPVDTEGIQRIYRVQRNNGFLPYVATIDLTTVIREPDL